MEALAVILAFVTVIALSGMALGFVDGRRKHQVRLLKEERLMVEARTKELEAQNRRIELEYQNAVVELERFDRRVTGLAGSTGLAGEPAPSLPDPAGQPPEQR